MSIFDKDDDPSTGSGDGGTLGTPSTDTEGKADVPSNDDANMVVSGGGVANTDEDDAAAAGDRGLG